MLITMIGVIERCEQKIKNFVQFYLDFAEIRHIFAFRCF